jgi:hypothetical protein
MNRRALFIGLAVAGYAIAGVWAYFKWWVPNHAQPSYYGYGTTHPGHPLWLDLLVTLGGLTDAIAFTCLACSRNMYRVYDGVVVDREFIPAHYQKTQVGGGYFEGGNNIVPGIWIEPQYRQDRVPDEWKLQLRQDDGRTGWVSVNQADYQTPDHQYINLRAR